MAGILGTVLPVFSLIVIGTAALRLRLMEAPALRGVNDFVYWLALPSLLFDSVARASQMRVLDVAGLYFVGAFAVYALAMLLARLLLGASLPNAAMVGLNASYGNTVMLGIPVVAAEYGAQGLATLLAIIALHSALLLPLASVLVEVGGERRGGLIRLARRTGAGLLRNPIIMSVVLAFLWRATTLTLPAPVHELLSLLGAGAPALALFCLGASLPRFGGDAPRMAWGETVLASVLKLAVMPVVVAALCWQAGLRGLPFAVSVLTAAMPTGANAFLLARQTGILIAASASTVVVSTALSVASLSGLIAWLR